MVIGNIDCIRIIQRRGYINLFIGIVIECYSIMAKIAIVLAA